MSFAAIESMGQQLVLDQIVKWDEVVEVGSKGVVSASKR